MPLERRYTLQDDKKIDEELEKAANKLFDQVQKSYQNKNYWEAAIDLILILDYYPNFSKIEEGLYYLAGSLYEMEMYDGAEQMYRYLLQTVKIPKLVAESVLGLQKVAYKKKEYQQSLKFYKVIESHYATHDLIYESRYYAVQTYCDLQNYDLVHNLIPHIKKKSDFYPFAIYTSGLAYLKKKTFVKPSMNCSKSTDSPRLILTDKILSIQLARRWDI